VLVLARLHSFLAYTESESDIDAAAYVKDLCGYLAASIDRPDAIHLVCETAELRLPTYKIVPLGFVISELVANSAKYAYPPPQAGAIYVSLAPRGDLWTLTIRDEGCGLGTAGTARAGGLGIRLVQRFVQQIGGELVTTSKGGVCHTISFRAEPEVANS
jgi:two-component sensor histidine kinase